MKDQYSACQRKRNHFFSVMVFFCLLLLSSISQAAIRVTSFQWSADETGITIINASAVVTYPGRECFGDYKTCGLSLSMSPSTIPVQWLILFQKPASSLTSADMVAGINKLSGQHIPYAPGVTRSNIQGACVYEYLSAPGLVSHSILSGVCSGGDIKPVPTPATCTLSLGDQIMDFGDISAAAFLKAGVGKVPAGVSQLQNTLTLNCSSPQSSMVSLSVTTSKASGSMLVSSESNVGFQMSFGSKSPTVSPIIPNNATSVVLVSVGSTGQGSTLINAVPVSVTGKKPLAGTFSAVAVIEAAWY